MTSVYQGLYAVLCENYPTFSNAWESARDTNGDVWEREFSERAGRLFGFTSNNLWQDAIAGYAEFCTDALRAQVFFERFGRYPATDYLEVTKSCYLDEDYMNRRYLPGQYLSHYIWPHHYKMMKRFSEVLLNAINEPINLFCEVGVGCGMYSLQTLLKRQESKGLGFDISPHSISFTQRVINAHALNTRYDAHIDDAFSRRDEFSADLVISQEVLEHLPNPDEFIEQLRGIVRPRGWGYITAAINAAHTDHIYLYRSPEEVARQLTRAGWEIMDQQIESNYPEKRVEVRPTIAGFLVRSLA